MKDVLVIIVLVICAICSSIKECVSDIGEKVYLKKMYTNETELQQDIVDLVSKRYGMQFEISPALNGNSATIGISEAKKEYGFYGYLRPADLAENYKEYNLCTDYTVCNETGTFKTQAHVRMFEKQLKAEVDKVFEEIGMKYDIIEFRGMDRDVNKWSKKSSYESYKASKDYETWIYIKLPPEQTKNYDEIGKFYAPMVLPMVKELYSALEPTYNVTLTFYIDEYARDVIVGGGGSSKQIREVLKNPDVVWLDLSKFNNYLDWTEEDIESEVNITNDDYFITSWKKANGLEQRKEGR